MPLPHLPRPVMMARYRAQPGRLVLPDVRCDVVWAGERLTFVGPMSRPRPTLFEGSTWSSSVSTRRRRER